MPTPSILLPLQRNLVQHLPRTHPTFIYTMHQRVREERELRRGVLDGCERRRTRVHRREPAQLPDGRVERGVEEPVVDAVLPCLLGEGLGGVEREEGGEEEARHGGCGSRQGESRCRTRRTR